MESKPTDQPIIKAEYPFDDSDPELADVILRTPDGTQFFANKQNLSMVSPVFKGMFSIPLPPTQEGSPISSANRPCIPVQDDSAELFQLLCWCDPRGEPSYTLDSFKAVLKLSDKYGMDRIVYHIGKAFERNSDTLVKGNCIRVYAIAIRYHLPDVARIAARYSLKMKIKEIPDVEEFKHVSAQALHRLLSYHFACSESAKSLLVKCLPSSGQWKTLIVNWSEASPIYTRCVNCHQDPHFWVGSYINMICNLVDETPVGEKAENQYIISVSLPSVCAHMYRSFMSFTTSLSNRIDECTSQVMLELDQPEELKNAGDPVAEA